MLRFETSETVDRDRKTGYYVKAWRGKAEKPYAYYRFPSAERRDNWIVDQRALDLAAEERKALRSEAKRKALETFANPFTIGDILEWSWGYEQTNIQFFEVVATTARSITVREIAAERTETGFMQGRAIPKSGAFLADEKPMKKTMQVFVDWQGKAGAPYVSMPYGSMQKWDGQPAFWSSYA